MFLLLVIHDVGHGLASNVVLITNDRLKAIQMARDIEEFGYEFFSDAAGVFLLSLEEGRAYKKDELKIVDNIIPAGYPFQRVWKKKDSRWEEKDLIPGATYPQPF